MRYKVNAPDKKHIKVHSKLGVNIFIHDTIIYDDDLATAYPDIFIKEEEEDQQLNLFEEPIVVQKTKTDFSGLYKHQKKSKRIT